MLSGSVTVTATIGPRGGSLAIPAAGLTVRVPAGAVASPTAFTATALGGEMVAYAFGPNGLVFRVPFEVTQDLTLTAWRELPDPSAMEAGYFQSEDHLDHGRRRARVAEFLPVRLDAGGQRLRFDVEHFSGYMVCSGRVQAQ